MKLETQVKITLENYDKCFAYSDADCPLGQLFDYACALQSFAMQKMDEQKKYQDSLKKKDIEPVSQENQEITGE